MPVGPSTRIRPPTRTYAPYPPVDDPAALGLESTTISSGTGTTIAYHQPQRGSDRATLFLHGAAGSWSTWTPLLRAAHDSGAALPDPVMFDLPGWGGAVGPSHDALTIDSVCELVRAAAAELGYSRWDVVGHSMGGFIAMHLAARWPDEVLSVVTISGTSWSLVDSVHHPVRNVSLLPHFAVLWRIMALLAALGERGRVLVRWMVTARLLRPAVLPLFRHPFHIDEAVITALARDIRPGSFLAAVDITRDYRPDVSWAAISCPITAVTGDRDALLRESDLERLTRLLPSSRTLVITDCGHFAQIEQPDALLEVIVASR